jgi:hypothetical protein
MRVVRVWLPVAIIVAGVIAIVATGGSEAGWEGGVAIVAAGMSVWLLNIIFRVGVSGERDRDAEDEARAYYAEHGYWPDEAPPPAAGAETEVDADRAPDAEPSRDDPHRPPPHSRHPAGRPGGAARRPPRRP